ncbi:Ecm7p ASCRUDRAFT_67473 [Ascoidea rubescens DSM 1968]|uniref:Uncharacterized protein n=1 Tax=Ascoidea rubescens DSM 1968 TaxID=1344418 RepID=A0A1D2VP12_9ASCO|nr:hypothetical protein ASCRUDRAFT_67473 [Ascoidea rubescens DSM 1968]ODV63362.1 hypothetical protein ASCRUDRAFT_67473 [Ascoidea rubescens DSM 1968]
MVIVIVLTLQSKSSIRSATSLYMFTLNCNHVTVADGLFAALRNKQQSNYYRTGDTYGIGFTTSEINILTDYTTDQVKECPQIILSNLHEWCYGDYTLSDNDDFDSSNKELNYFSNKNFTITECYSLNNTFFNYVQMLDYIDLTIILDYAYNGDFSNENSDYAKLTATLNKNKPTLLTLSDIGLSSNCALIIFAFCIFFFRNQQKVKKVLKHVCGLLSLVSLATICPSFILIYIQSIQVKRQIQQELSDFGIWLHMGRRWFILSWTCFTLAVLSFGIWGFTTWLILPRDQSPDTYHNSISLDHNYSYENRHEGTSKSHTTNNPTLISFKSHSPENSKVNVNVKVLNSSTSSVDK